MLNWPHCSLACTHTRPSGRGRWPSQLWPGHGKLLYIRHHVVTCQHQASAAWTIIKSAASQSSNNNGQQHREHSSHFAESVAYLDICLPLNGKEGLTPLLCPWSLHGLYVIQLRLRSRACARLISICTVAARTVAAHLSQVAKLFWPGQTGNSHGQI